MTTARARLPYLNKDYDAIRADLVARIPQLTDRWTDLNPSDLGIVLLELVAGVGDMLAYYLDAQAAECYLPTARRRQSVIDLCALINYRLHGPVAATTVMRFALAAPLTQAVAIPAGTVLQAIGAGDPIPFETTNDAVLPAGQTGVDVGARQGDRRRELLAGMGAACQRLTLAQTAAHGTLTVAVNGTAWQEVEHFVDSGPADPHYRIALGGLDQTSVIFGDGRQGMAPPAGASIAVSYLVTLGPGGNLAPHLVTTLPSPVLVNGAPAALSVDNPLPATGGAEAESHEHARMLAPAVLRSTWKAVTKADYQALCLAFPGVAKAQVLDTNDDPSLRIYCVRIVVAPAGGDLPSPSLLADLQALLEARRMVTVEVSVEAPVYRPVPVSAVLYAYRGQEAEIVRQRAQAALADHFAFDRQDFGQAVYTSDLIALLDGIAGISHVALQAPAADIALAPRELATLGDVTLTVQEVR